MTSIMLSVAVCAWLAIAIDRHVGVDQGRWDEKTEISQQFDCDRSPLFVFQSSGIDDVDGALELVWVCVNVVSHLVHDSFGGLIGDVHWDVVHQMDDRHAEHVRKHGRWCDNRATHDEV